MTDACQCAASSHMRMSISLDARDDRAKAGLDWEHIEELADKREVVALAGITASGASSGRCRSQWGTWGGRLSRAIA